MNVNNITALKPHASYKKKLKMPSYPLFSDTKNFSDRYYPNPFKNATTMIPVVSTIPSLSPSPSPSPTPIPASPVEADMMWETTSPLITPENNPEPIGFIILRNVISAKTNKYWKECYRCIKKFYPKNRILIIDDNSNYSYVSNDQLENTMLIKSEFPKRGEFLPYYYYLRTHFCDTAVILHDSMFIKQYIDFNVDEYKFILDFGKANINDTGSLPYQAKLLNALNNEKLNNFYRTKDDNMWKGCFGCMSIIKYNYLKNVDNEFLLSSLIPHVTCRDDRCALERIIACLLQVNKKSEKTLLGNINTYNIWGFTYEHYVRNEYSNLLPIIKVFTGR